MWDCVYSGMEIQRQIADGEKKLRYTLVLEHVTELPLLTSGALLTTLTKCAMAPSS